MSAPTYTTKIAISNPEKIGDGFNAYVRYNLAVQTDNPNYKGDNFNVSRRFREFHALYETLVDLYRAKGIHIPHPPEKSITANTRVKIQNKNVVDFVQIEQRRVALERFINRLASHPLLGNDESVINFLTATVCTAKPRDFLLKFANNITSGLSKFIPDIEEYDQWFEEKFGKIVALENNLIMLHDTTYDLHNLRRELVDEYRRFSESTTSLRGAESNALISKALTALSELKAKAAQIMENQCLNELHQMVGSSRSTLDDIISVRHLLEQYTKFYNSLKSIKSKVQSKKEQLIKFEMYPEKADKVRSLKSEIEELDKKVSFETAELDTFYTKLKSEVNYFEEIRVKETRACMIRYFKEWQIVQNELLSLWENFLPACQAIK